MTAVSGTALGFPSGRSRPSSRCCGTGCSTGGRWRTWIRRRPRRRPTPVIDAMTSYYTQHRASIHRGVYPLADEATDAVRGRPRADRCVARLDAGGDDLHRERDRGDQHGRVHVGAPERAARRPRGADRDGAPLEHRAVAAAVPGPRGRARVRAGFGRRAAGSGRARCAAGAGSAAGGRCARVERPGDHQPGGRDRAARARMPAPWSWSTGRRRCRRCRSGCPIWTSTSTPGPATRRTARPAIGVLHGRRELLEEMPPFIGGGHMIRTVAANESTWTDLPWKFEAGTSQIAEAIGLGAAVDWIRSVGIERSVRTSRRWWRSAWSGLSAAEVPGVTVHGSVCPPPIAARWCRSSWRAPIRTTSRTSSGVRACACAPGTTARSR